MSGGGGGGGVKSKNKTNSRDVCESVTQHKVYLEEVGTGRG